MPLPGRTGKTANIVSETAMRLPVPPRLTILQERNAVLDTIRNRRSIRRFTDQDVPDSSVDTIIEMGTWAPSGLNNQPWKFVIARSPRLREEMSRLTRYGSIVRQAPVCIVVFLDQTESYDRTKDVQAVGACIQNMLLTAHHMGLGAVWLGEILKSRNEVRSLLDLPESLELMAVVALGHPAAPGGVGSRKPLDQVVLGRK